MNRMTADLNFVTQAHEEESHTVTCCALSLQKLYPNSTYHVYDGGLSEHSVRKLSSVDIVKVHDWREQANFESNFGRQKVTMANIELKIKSNKYLDYIVREFTGYNYPYTDVIRWNFYTKQKPLVIRDLCNKVDGNIFWLDEDVVVINQIDELFDNEFDIGGTIRSKYHEKYYEFSPLNSGVVIFNTSSSVIKMFVRKWLEKIKQLDRSTHQEQIAISKLFAESNPRIFESYNNTGQLEVDSMDIKTQVFPCKMYNYWGFNLGGGSVHPKENKILHFKNESNSEMNRKFMNDIIEGDVSRWHRGRSREIERT